MKKKYSVYLLTYWADEVTGEITLQGKTLLGETYAISKAKSINNVRYRFYGERNPEGVEQIDYACGGYLREFKAEEA